MRQCFLDLETTGFDPKKDSIIECSFIVCENNEEITRFDQVFIPDKSPLNDFVIHLTGITPEEINNHGLDFKEKKEEIETLIGEAIIIGHNIDFDINFLIENGINVKTNPRIDTHELARILLPLEASYALEVLTEKYGFNHTNAHRAMSDVEASKDFFVMMLERIQVLPEDFLKDISLFLETKTNWFAKKLFLKSKGQKLSIKEETKPTKTSSDQNIELPENFYENSCEWNIKFQKKSSQTLTQIASINPEKSVIVTPRIDFYEDQEKFPTPEVILDPEKLSTFASQRNILNDQETTFFLKCMYRKFIGYRGVFYFDLFFKERDLWKEIAAEETGKIFQDILKEKEKHKTLIASPAAYFRFIDEDIFSKRYAILDEGEHIGESLLFTPAKTFSLLPYLNHFDEEIAKKTQFITSRFCRDFIEVKLGHEIGPFPQKILLEERENLSSLIKELDEFMNQDDWAFWKEILENPPDQSVRWLIYYPESGSLTFGYWHPEDWRNLKSKLQSKKKLLTRRTEGPESDLFFHTFLAAPPLEKAPLESSIDVPNLIIPETLVSTKSPDFNDFTTKFIEEIFQNTSGNLAINFSSLEALRNVYESLTQLINDESVFIIGEKVKGGNGKILELLEQNKTKRIIFCFQKMSDPKLKSFQFENLIIQKFPFAPPQPLLEKIKQSMAQNGKNFWDIWTMTHTKSEISKKTETLNGLKNIYLLDSRSNASWGKNVIESVFS